MSKYRVIVHHVSTDKYWIGRFEKFDDEELASVNELLQTACESGNYLSIENEHGNKFFIPKNLMQECVYTLEKSHEND